MRSPLKAKIVSGERCSELLLQEMWRLRLEFLELKIERDDDWDQFKTVLRRPNTLLILFRDKQKQLQGYFTFAFKPIVRDERQALIVHSKYYYVRPKYRGHPQITAAAWRLWPGIIMRYGMKQMYFIAFSFPTSFVSLSRTFGQVMTLQSVQTPAWERQTLIEFVRSETAESWDETQRLIRNQNVPQGEHKPLSKAVQSKDIKSLQTLYLSMNPDWEQGVSLPIMMKFDWPTIKSVLKNNWRRSKRAKRNQTR